jgi:hypothetical protein
MEQLSKWRLSSLFGNNKQRQLILPSRVSSSTVCDKKRQLLHIHASLPLVWNGMCLYPPIFLSSITKFDLILSEDAGISVLCRIPRRPTRPHLQPQPHQNPTNPPHPRIPTSPHPRAAFTSATCCNQCVPWAMDEPGDNAPDSWNITRIPSGVTTSTVDRYSCMQDGTTSLRCRRI